MLIPDSTLQWLLEGDVAIQYQVHRDLLDSDRPDLQARISQDGWGARFLSARNPNGHWGRAFSAAYVLFLSILGPILAQVVRPLTQAYHKLHIGG